MTTDQDQVIVSLSECDCHSIHLPQVHHRDLPEIRGEGETNQAAARHLAQQLTLALDNVEDHWRREIIERALADVEAYAEHGRHAPSH